MLLSWCLRKLKQVSFSFTAAFIGSDTGCRKQTLLTTVYTAYSNRYGSFIFNKSTAGDETKNCAGNENPDDFKAFLKHFFECPEDGNLFTQKFIGPIRFSLNIK